MTTIRNNRAPQILRAIEKAAAAALNRAGSAMRAEAQRRLAAETGLKQRSVKRRLRTEAASAGKLEVSVGISGVPVRAIQLGARQGPQGTTVGPRGARTLLTSAFIAKGRRGRAVFRRTTRKRGPVEAQLSEPLAVVATRAKILEAMLARGEQVFTERMKHELGRALGGGR